jgi:hypothetical protein
LAIVRRALLAIVEKVLHHQIFHRPDANLIGGLRPFRACTGLWTTIRSAFVVRGGLEGEQKLDAFGNLGVLQVSRSSCMELEKTSVKYHQSI